MSDRSRDTSEALIEIRTVRSRAESAIARIDHHPSLGDKIERRDHPAGMDEDVYLPRRTEWFRDEDADEMVALLADFVKATEKFVKRGRQRRDDEIRKGH
jgi:hypothetical protein